MSKAAHVSFRIGDKLWENADNFESLLALFRKHTGLVDDIALFTQNTHSPRTEDAIKSIAPILKQRMARAREDGYISGVNILCTIGHHNENLPNSISDDYARITDIDGNISRGSMCPSSETTYGYANAVYTAIAEADPDYIWVDDDVRLFGHMPIDAGCFCDNCLKIFESECGVSYTRESLKHDLNEAPIEKKLEVRKTWMKHNADIISRLFDVIEKTVHGVKPGLTIGFMTGDRFYEGYDFDGWAKHLAGPDKSPIIWRPGGGVYNDEKPGEIIIKAHSMGRQISVLPQDVKCIQSEIENFPYQTLKKSVHATALEGATYIAAGCTGAAFNVLMDRPPKNADAINEYEPIVSKAAGMRPFYDLLVSTFGRNMPEGIYTGWNKNIFASNNACGGDWFKGDSWQIADGHAVEALDTGLPAAYSLDKASVSLLSGGRVLALSEDEILKILSSGAYIDAEALEHLNKMGYSELTGFKTAGYITEDAIEELTDDPLNLDFGGTSRDCRQSFLWWLKPAAILDADDKSARTLAKIIDYSGNVTGECGMGIFENKLGGRVCVAGYYPWTFLQSKAKASQIKSVMRWLSKDKLPAYVDSYHKASVWARDIDGKISIAILNSSLDPAEGLSLKIRTDKNDVTVYDSKCRACNITCSASDGPYKIFNIPCIDAWNMNLILA